MRQLESSGSFAPRSLRRLRLAAGEVHLWSATLDLGADLLRQLTGTLDGEERTRVKRLRFRRDQRHATASRGLLRALLAAYTGVDPGSLRFGTTGRGKPFLEGALRDRLAFNVTHSDGLLLVAVAVGGPLGVDLEREKSLPDLEQIARRFFSIDEQQALRRLPPADRLHGFYRCWTRKEAYLKAVGDGLWDGLDRFSTALDLPARLLSIDGDARTAAEWTLLHVEPAAGYVGALALRSPHPQLCTWQMDLTGRPRSPAPAAGARRGEDRS